MRETQGAIVEGQADCNYIRVDVCKAGSGMTTAELTTTMAMMCFFVRRVLGQDRRQVRWDGCAC